MCLSAHLKYQPQDRNRKLFQVRVLFNEQALFESLLDKQVIQSKKKLTNLIQFFWLQA